MDVSLTRGAYEMFLWKYFILRNRKQIFVKGHIFILLSVSKLIHF